MLMVGNMNIMIEMKHGRESSYIYDVMKEVHEYWSSYEYMSAGIEIFGSNVDAIDAFVIATQVSTDGHLFKHVPKDTSPTSEDREKSFRKTYPDNQNWNDGERPQFEYARTEAIPRIMWRYAWLEAEARQGEERDDISAGIGVPLSDALDKHPGQSGMEEFLTSNENATSDPKVLIYNGEGGSQWVSF